MILALAIDLVLEFGALHSTLATLTSFSICFLMILALAIDRLLEFVALHSTWATLTSFSMGFFNDSGSGN